MSYVTTRNNWTKAEIELTTIILSSWRKSKQKEILWDAARSRLECVRNPDKQSDGPKNRIK